MTVKCAVSVVQDNSVRLYRTRHNIHKNVMTSYMSTCTPCNDTNCTSFILSIPPWERQSSPFSHVFAADL